MSIISTNQNHITSAFVCQDLLYTLKLVSINVETSLKASLHKPKSRHKELCCTVGNN